MIKLLKSGALFFLLFSIIMHSANQDIIEVQVHPSDFLDNDNFIEKKLANLLSRSLGKQNKIFNNDQCLSVRDLGKGGGYNTLQLFLVSSTCTGKKENYIVKEPRHGLDEIQPLKRIAGDSRVNDLALPNLIPGLPSLALPVGYISYIKSNIPHYLVIMPAAVGNDLASLILQFRNNPSPLNKKILSEAFNKLGEETANFYRRNMIYSPGKLLGKTIIHGDFHQYNLFYDSQKNHFTFIDNETIAKSLASPSDIATDLLKLFFMPFSINRDYQQFRDLISGIDLKTWFDISFKNFLIGYQKAYTKNEQPQLLKELQQLFMAPFTIKWVDFDNAQLNEIRTKFFVPIFQELNKQFPEPQNNRNANKSFVNFIMPKPFFINI